MAKHPSYSVSPPQTSKQPRLGETKTGTGNPIWRIGRIDFDGPWCPKGIHKEVLLQVVSKLKHFESTPWTEIERHGSHFIAVKDLIPDAKKRLQLLRLDDTDVLFSLRLSGRERLWGLRSNDVFAVLWWDPEHQICPSEKKHT